jgi:N6-adenosine-specific RNA methylase IME4
MSRHELILLDRATAAISRVQTVAAVKEIADKAAAIKVLAAKQGWGRREKVRIGEIEIRATVRMGELLSKTPGRGKRGGDRKSTSAREVDQNGDLGVSDKQSHVAQLAATAPKEEMEMYLRESVETEKVPTVSAIVRMARKARRPKGKARLPEGKYRVIYADPPWEYANAGHDDYGAAERHYPTLPLDELCALPVADLALDDAVLFLWVPSPLLEDAFRVGQAWGFFYKASFVWDKVKHNYGHYNSVRHEFLLVCTRGSCLPDSKKLADSVVSIERSEHSRKPDYFRNLIDEMYPKGRHIELFARGEVKKGWDAYGNEAGGGRQPSRPEEEGGAPSLEADRLGGAA